MIITEQITNNVNKLDAEIFDLYVQQAYTLGISHMLLCFIILMCIVYVTRKLKDKTEDQHYFYPMLITLVVAVIFGGLVIINMVPEIFTCLFNPEYWALQQILEDLK